MRTTRASAKATSKAPELATKTVAVSDASPHAGPEPKYGKRKRHQDEVDDEFNPPKKGKVKGQGRKDGPGKQVEIWPDPIKIVRFERLSDELNEELATGECANHNLYESVTQQSFKQKRKGGFGFEVVHSCVVGLWQALCCKGGPCTLAAICAAYVRRTSQQLGALCIREAMLRPELRLS